MPKHVQSHHARESRMHPLNSHCAEEADKLTCHPHKDVHILDFHMVFTLQHDALCSKNCFPCMSCIRLITMLFTMYAIASDKIA